MKCFIRVVRVALTLLTICTSSQSAAAVATPAPMTLRDQVVIDHANMTLQDLVILPANNPAPLALRAVRLGHAPRIGYTLRFTRAELDNLLRRHMPEQRVVWDGAASVSIATQAQVVDPLRLREAALAQLHADFADPSDIITVELPEAPLDIPFGSYLLQARPAQLRRGAGRMVIWIDVLVDGAVYRSVVLPVGVTRERDALVARRAIDAGSRVSGADFETRRVNVAGIAVAAPAALAGVGGRLRNALGAGQVLTEDALAVQGAIFRGDQVRVTIQASGIGIETVAVAQAPALPGQTIVVRTSRSGENLSGRVTRAGDVVID